jgi:hypothetical protein
MLHYIGVILHASKYIFDIGNAVTSGQWIPFTGVIITSLPTCTYKAISAFVTINQSLWILGRVKMIFGASRLFLVYLSASSQTL